MFEVRGQAVLVHARQESEMGKCQAVLSLGSRQSFLCQAAFLLAAFGSTSLWEWRLPLSYSPCEYLLQRFILGLEDYQIIFL